MNSPMPSDQSGGRPRRPRRNCSSPANSLHQGHGLLDLLVDLAIDQSRAGDWRNPSTAPIRTTTPSAIVRPSVVNTVRSQGTLRRSSQGISMRRQAELDLVEQRRHDPPEVDQHRDGGQAHRRHPPRGGRAASPPRRPARGVNRLTSTAPAPRAPATPNRRYPATAREHHHECPGHHHGRDATSLAPGPARRQTATGRCCGRA